MSFSNAFIEIYKYNMTKLESVYDKHYFIHEHELYIKKDNKFFIVGQLGLSEVQIYSNPVVCRSRIAKSGNDFKIVPIENQDFPRLKVDIVTEIKNLTVGQLVCFDDHYIDTEISRQFPVFMKACTSKSAPDKFCSLIKLTNREPVNMYEEKKGNFVYDRSTGNFSTC